MKLNIGIIGLGTVGRGFLEILNNNPNELKQKHDIEAVVTAVCDRSCGVVYNPEGLQLEELIAHSADKRRLSSSIFEGDVYELIKTAEVDVWIELTHTNLESAFPAVDYIRFALTHRKNVITTNKGPASLYYRELSALAKERGVNFSIEGTVLAGTPAINLIEGPLAGCRIDKVRGIMNGTTNFILTEMESGNTYAQALDRARELGYAEADPSGDVEGSDSLAKVKILSNLLLHEKIREDAISCKGITGITSRDISDAKQQNKRWKLIGTIELSNGSSRVRVEPELLDQSHPLAGVNGNMNALTFTTDLLGEVTIIGPGAGKKETGFAVLNGVINSCQVLKT